MNFDEMAQERVLFLKQKIVCKYMCLQILSIYRVERGFIMFSKPVFYPIAVLCNKLCLTESTDAIKIVYYSVLISLDFISSVLSFHK